MCSTVIPLRKWALHSTENASCVVLEHAFRRNLYK
jgi:hypothetical protein